jgi:hypothetical protein
MIPCSKMEAPLVCIEVGGAILRPPGQGQRIQEAGGAGAYAGTTISYHTLNRSVKTYIYSIDIIFIYTRIYRYKVKLCVRGSKTLHIPIRCATSCPLTPPPLPPPLAGVHRPLRRNYGTKQRRAYHRDLLIRSQPKGTLLGLAHGNLVSYTATLRCLEDTLYRTSWGSDVDLIVHGLSLARFPLNETSDAPRGGAAFHG